MFNDLCIVETFKETQLITVKKKKNNLYHLSHILLLKKRKRKGTARWKRSQSGEEQRDPVKFCSSLKARAVSKLPFIEASLVFYQKKTSTRESNSTTFCYSPFCAGHPGWLDSGCNHVHQGLASPEPHGSAAPACC